jgi:hypothetical protein
MKKLLILSLFIALLLQTAASSDNTVREINRKVQCGVAKEILAVLVSEDYMEAPYWMGEDSSTGYVLMVNERTRSWTLLQYNDDTACVLGTGIKHRRVYNGPLI